jgi:hypothetical protein
MVFTADFRRYVDENVVIYAASNAEMTAIALTEVLPALVFGVEYAMPPDVVKLDAAALDRFAGTYLLPSGGRIELAREGDALRAAAVSRDAFALLYPTAPAEIAERANARIAAIVEAGSKGDYRPVAEAFAGAMPAAEVNENEGRLWRDLRERLGAFKGFEVLGTARMRPMAATIVRLDFERGSQYMRFGWDGGQLVGIRMLPEPPALRLYPTSATELVSFDLRDPNPVRARAAGERLTLQRGTAEVTGIRHQ